MSEHSRIRRKCFMRLKFAVPPGCVKSLHVNQTNQLSVEIQHGGGPALFQRRGVRIDRFNRHGDSRYTPLHAAEFCCTIFGCTIIALVLSQADLTGHAGISVPTAEGGQRPTSPGVRSSSPAHLPPPRAIFACFRGNKGRSPPHLPAGEFHPRRGQLPRRNCLPGRSRILTLGPPADLRA